MTPERALRAVVERLEIENETLRQKLDRLTHVDQEEWRDIASRYRLTPVQARIVLHLSKKLGVFTSTEELSRALFHAECSQTVKVHIKNIRRKLAPHGIGVETAFAVGYRLIGWPS